ncbi:protein kinase [Amycolatopsis sp. MtRt-6]|uniref:protein kinase domain-containing protein n=1 Tax=Amycolatopsis sp. MtRt-6 TaxID=2792782 RepID=UPI001A8FB175|nr:protein kinase [Amycolatopsis sp. MtRt-6]
MENPPADGLIPYRDGPHASSYLAPGDRPGERVVVKVLREPLDRQTRVAFDRERAALARLRAAPIRLAERVTKLPDGRTALAAPWCAESLADRVARTGPLGVPETLAVATAVAKALAAAHDAGVPHGGVHPGNVLFTDGGEPVVADFGVSLRRRFGRSPSADVGFLAPETLSRGVMDAAADRYGLGALLHFCRTGQAPFPAAPGERADALVLRVFDAPPPELADVPPALARLVTGLLAKEPRDRPDDEAVLAALAALREARGEPLLVLEPRPAEQPAPHRKRRGPALALAGLAVAVVVVAAVLLWRKGGTSPAPPAPAPAPASSTAAGAVRIDLDPPVDRQDHVELTWHAPPNLDFAVLVTEAGQARPTVVLAQRLTSKQITVRPGRAYCFRIQATSPRGTWQSQARGIREAVC